MVVTGLYLYAFFETSVAAAYPSVEALTHGQRFAGGLMRSLHRYASDAMVLAMLLHLARHFTFGRHRGFRWFSWVSGVAALARLRVGINGYMLPWDRLSQFVVTATTEWFDVLPVIGGSMTRNFVSNANVTDRLFSLLSFIHIGLPLTVMAVLWIHTQRTPGAKTNPPRPLMIGIVLSLTALAIIKPAVSQGAPADMATLPAIVDFDWFYLPVYPLIEHWGPSETWLLTLGATLLLLALPWLPPRRDGSQPEWSMAVHPDERIIDLRSGETLLDAGLRQGLPMPFECRNGGCGTCKATLLHGKVRLEPYQESALTSAERDAGKTLLCCAEPLSDVEIEYVPQIGPKALPIKQYVARVSRLEPLTQDVIRLCLRLEGGTALHFHAGQYINIVLADGAKRSFSFATAPHAADEIELHVRLIPGGRFTTEVFTTHEGGRHAALRRSAGRLHPARGQRQADPVCRRLNRLRAGQEHAGTCLP